MPLPTSVTDNVIFSPSFTAQYPGASSLQGINDQNAASYGVAQKAIYQYLSAGWAAGGELQAMIARISAGHALLINYAPGKFEATALGSFEITIDLLNPIFDPASTRQAFFFNSDGVPVPFTRQRSFFHELGHAILSYDDGAFGRSNLPADFFGGITFSDLEGINVEKENLFASLTGDNNVRVDYPGSFYADELPDRTSSYSNNEFIWTAFVRARPERC